MFLNKPRCKHNEIRSYSKSQVLFHQRKRVKLTWKIETKWLRIIWRMQSTTTKRSTRTIRSQVLRIQKLTQSTCRAFTQLLLVENIVVLLKGQFLECKRYLHRNHSLKYGCQNSQLSSQVSLQTIHFMRIITVRVLHILVHHELSWLEILTSPLKKMWLSPFRNA